MLQMSKKMPVLHSVVWRLLFLVGALFLTVPSAAADTSRCAELSRYAGDSDPRSASKVGACLSAAPIDVAPLLTQAAARQSALSEMAQIVSESLRRRQDLLHKGFVTAQALGLAALLLGLIVYYRGRVPELVASVLCSAVGGGFLAFAISVLLFKDTFGWRPLIYITLGTSTLGPALAVAFGIWVYRRTRLRHRMIFALTALAFSLAMVLFLIWY
jgi:hypothetical protein